MIALEARSIDARPTAAQTFASVPSSRSASSRPSDARAFQPPRESTIRSFFAAGSTQRPVWDTSTGNGTCSGLFCTGVHPSTSYQFYHFATPARPPA